MSKPPRRVAPSAFSDLALVEPLLRAIAAARYREPTPIQIAAIPALLEGRDVLGSAQTGTGKTAAFALPVLQRMNALPTLPLPNSPRALVLAPTRELALQTCDAFRRYARYLRGVRVAAVFGGLAQGDQVAELKRGVDVVVGTPGRLIDLRAQKLLDLGAVEMFVLDEADRMLDLGFLPDVRRLMAALPKERQVAFFSATLPGDVVRLGTEMMHHPFHAEVARRSAVAETVAHFACFTREEDKRPLLVELLKRHAGEKALVFISGKRETNRLRAFLTEEGIGVRMLHGRMNQASRLHALEELRDGRVRVLVATDVAARGLDIKGLGLVVNFDLPSESEGYVHRIGRTGRAGHAGRAITLCAREDRRAFHAVQDLGRFDFAPITDHPWHSEAAMDFVMHRPGQWRAPSLRPASLAKRKPRLLDWGR